MQLRQMRWLAVTGIAALWLAGSPSALAADPKPGIVGSDDRTVTADPRFAAVGRLNLSGTGFCTATLIRPNVVVTAAHCLTYKRTGKPIPPDRLHFVAGWRKGKYAAHRRGRATRIHAEYKGAASPGQRMASDIALIVLDKPIPASVIAPIPLDRGTGSVRMTVPLTHVSYARDRAHLPSVETGCVVRKVVGRMLLTDCDANFGGSGAPVLRERDGALHVLGVVSGVVEVNGLRRVAAVRTAPPAADGTGD